MSQGAENIDYINHPLLSALFAYMPIRSSWTYAFVDAGELVYKGSYSGGDDKTRAWTGDEKNDFRAVVNRFQDVANLTFIEESSTSISYLDLQMVDNVPGGLAGYAGGSNYVVGSSRSSLLTHELEHTVGLSHPFSGNVLPGVIDTLDPGDNGFNSRVYTNLAYRYGGYAEYPGLDVASPSSLGAFDIAVLQAMYGTNSTSRTGDDSYGIPTEVHTIWDAGGQDEIDFSATGANVRVDLRAATLMEEAGGGGWASFVDQQGHDANAYTIAYGVVIENGVTGTGNDTLQGNDAANYLVGGLGNDIVFGGDGDDTIEGSGAGDQDRQLTMIHMNDSTVTNRSLEADGYDMPGDVTVDMVVQMDPTVSHAHQLLSFLPDASGEVGLQLRVWYDATPYLYAIIDSPSGDSSILWTNITKEEIADGNIHRLTVTRDSVTGTYNFYLDGMFRADATDRPGEAQLSAGSLIFGQSQGVWGTALKGGLGSIAIYSGVLNSTEIAARDIDDLADTSDPRLVSYWVPDAMSGGYADAVWQRWADCGQCRDSIGDRLEQRQ